MDKHLSMSEHITKTCQSSVIAIHKIGQILQYLDGKSTEILVHFLIMFHVDNCNVLIKVKIPKTELNHVLVTSWETHYV